MPVNYSVHPFWEITIAKLGGQVSILKPVHYATYIDIEHYRNCRNIFSESFFCALNQSIWTQETDILALNWCGNKGNVNELTRDFLIINFRFCLGPITTIYWRNFSTWTLQSLSMDINFFDKHIAFDRKISVDDKSRKGNKL